MAPPQDEHSLYDSKIRDMNSTDDVPSDNVLSYHSRCLRLNTNEYRPTEGEDSTQKCNSREMGGSQKSQYGDSDHSRDGFEELRVLPGYPQLTRRPTTRQSAEELFKYHCDNYLQSSAATENHPYRNPGDNPDSFSDISGKEYSVAGVEKEYEKEKSPETDHPVTTSTSEKTTALPSPKKNSDRPRWFSFIARAWKSVLDFERDHLTLYQKMGGDDDQSSCSSSMNSDCSRGQKHTRRDHAREKDQA